MSAENFSGVVDVMRQAMGGEDSDRQIQTGILGRRDNLSTVLQAGESLLETGAGSAVAGSPLPVLKDSSSVSQLAWLIPAVIVGIFAMLGVAFACYLGVRRLEMRMLHWCRVNCACCCGPDEETGRLLIGDSYNRLSQTSRKEAVRLKDFRERAPSYGVTRDTHEQYVPRKDFNPFDDD